MAADAFLRRHEVAAPSSVEADALEKEIALEVAAWKKRAKKRRVA